MAAAHIRRRNPGLLLFQHRDDLFLAEPAPLQIHPTPSRSGRYSNLEKIHGLGGVDKFEPVSGGGDMDHSEEAVGKLVVAGGDGAVDLEMAEHAFDAVSLLVERPVMLDLHAAV